MAQQVKMFAAKTEDEFDSCDPHGSSNKFLKVVIGQARHGVHTFNPST